jgi:enoyl-CoA hydratase
MTYERILYDAKNGIATITVNRENVRNAIDRRTAEEIGDAISRASEDRAAGVVVFRGAGEKAFVAGADIRDLAAGTAPDVLEACHSRLYAAIEACPRVTIAAINGHALGGGLELALACDLRVAAREATFGFPEVGLGILPGAGGTQRLPRLVGLGRAKEMILTGEPIDADEALRIGLVNRVVPRAKLEAAVRELASKILARGPVALRLAKAALNVSARVDLASGLEFEILAQTVLFGTKDREEGVRAFLEKRKPEFRGE